MSRYGPPDTHLARDLKRLAQEHMKLGSGVLTIGFAYQPLNWRYGDLVDPDLVDQHRRIVHDRCYRAYLYVGQPIGGHARITVLDVQGDRVYTLSGNLAKGTVRWINADQETGSLLRELRS